MDIFLAETTTPTWSLLLPLLVLGILLRSLLLLQVPVVHAVAHAVLHLGLHPALQQRAPPMPQPVEPLAFIPAAFIVRDLPREGNKVDWKPAGPTASSKVGKPKLFCDPRPSMNILPHESAKQ